MIQQAWLPALPRRAWVILGGDILSGVGTGLTYPFLLVYLHRVRGIDLAVAGLVLSVLFGIGVLGAPAGGAMSDRVGAKRTLVAGLLLAACGGASLAFAERSWQAFASAAVLGFGGSVIRPAEYALLATIVSRQQRSSIFSVQNVTTNIGFGLGALLTAAIVDFDSLLSFQVVYVLDGASFAAFAVVLICLRQFERSVSFDDTGPEEDEGYRTVLRDRLFLHVWVVMALLVTLGYAQYQTAFAAYATEEGGLSASSLAVVFAGNMFAVVVLQLIVLRLMHGRRRTLGITSACAAFGLAWAVALVGGMIPEGASVIAVFALAMIILAVGETFTAPTVPPLVNDLAPDHLRGHYNGALTLAWIAGYTAGPAVSGLVLGAGHGKALLLGLVAGCAATSLITLWLQHRLPIAVNLVGTELRDDGLTTNGP